jgi:hypothetical protein
MIICKNCGVELEADMLSCPLCGQPVNSADKIQKPSSYLQQAVFHKHKMTRPQRKFTWQIISLILLSAIVATFLINFIINKKITWSEYPVAISLIIFSYVSLFAFWDQKTALQMGAGFILSSGCIIALDATTGTGIEWSLQAGIPLLLVTNLIAVVLITVIRRARHKGVNLLAWGFLAAALLCICIEGILSYHQTKSFHFIWSVIVAGCTVPVVLVLIFTHFRLRKGRSLKKTFHI